MQTYKIIYEVSMTGTVQAENEEEARRLVANGEVEMTEDEITSDMEVFKIR